jgi:hypothetical protein
MRVASPVWASNGGTPFVHWLQFWPRPASHAESVAAFRLRRTEILERKVACQSAEIFLCVFFKYFGKRPCSGVSIRAEWLRFEPERSVLVTFVALIDGSDSARLRKDLIMPVAAEQNVSAETLRRIARDVIHLELTDTEISSLAPVLRELLDNVEAAAPPSGDRARPDSDAELALEGRPRR